MKQRLKYVAYFLVLALIVFLAWRFAFILVWVMIAGIVSFIGQPLLRFYKSLRIIKIRISHTVGVILALATILIIFLGLFAIFVPLIVKQAETISKIDVRLLAENLQHPLQWLEDGLHSLGVIPWEQGMDDFIIVKAKSFLDVTFIGHLLNNIFNVAGTFMVGLFSVIFISFFFMKDGEIFEENIFSLLPEKHHGPLTRILAESKNLLRRYFVGVILELLSVMSIIAIGLWIFGVENALLIGFFGGLMNIIPYLGPIIGIVVGMTLGITTTLASGNYADILPVILKLAGVLFTANLIDNNILVPYIYSTSVKAHPLEIFFIIIIGGSLAGILGMLLAIPVYTVLRVILRELYAGYQHIK